MSFSAIHILALHLLLLCDEYFFVVHCGWFPSSHHIHIYYFLLKIVRKSMANDFEYPKALLKLKDFFYLTTKTDKVVCNRVLRDTNVNMRINLV